MKTFTQPILMLALAVLGLFSSPELSADGVDIIPKPSRVEVLQGNPFVLRDGMKIFYAPAFKAQAEYLENLLETSTGYDFLLKEGSGRKDIILGTDPLAQKEGYALTVGAKAVDIRANDAAGAFYGIQSFLQLLPAEVYSRERQKDVAWEAQPVRISDAPERPWRGMMLDVARYFYDMDFVKKYVDMMAMYKMNILQFHMIDDSGWRLEIKKYPKLTEVGAWAKTGVHPLGGFYTQEEITDLVEYAAVRGVQIIPEIEFPAHVLSAVVAYPWLCCTGLQHELPDHHFISRDLLCVGKESTYRFLTDVMEEVVELFPCRYINIGGDEARYDQWEKCPLCQKVRKEQGLEKTSELQGYLTNWVANMLAEKGRTVVGWEEIFLRGKVERPIVGMMWHNVADSLMAKKTGHKAVLIPATHAYFDFPESSTPGEVKGATWMPPIPLETVYSMPVNDYSEESTVLGVQGCFWSDQFIHGKLLQEIPYLDENRSEQYAEYFSFPRVIALSEVAWGRESERDYKDFCRRMSTHYARLESKECNYRVPEPFVKALREVEGGYEYELQSPIEGREIRYTTDGSYPHLHSALYTEPVKVARKDNFRAITIASPRHFSLPLFQQPDYSEFAEYGALTSVWKVNEMREQPRRWSFECTGKVNGNGSYEISFVQVRGVSKVKFGDLKVYKRNELMDEVEAEGQTVTDGNVVTWTFNIPDFEAGTPFLIDVEVKSEGGQDSAGYVFVKKAD